MIRSFALSLLLVAAGAPAFGSDDCSTATPLAGYGVYAFDNAAATTDGPAAPCGMGRDVWFRWTAPATETIAIDTCGSTSVDTALAVYAGGAACPPSGAPLACSDDAPGCGRQSRVVFTASAGEEYLVRLGTWAGAAAGGTGTFEIAAACAGSLAGPNVVAGDVGAVVTWATVGGTTAYSFAVTACNLGDEELLWIANGSDHPVIAQNLYRLEDGRLEQIGMSWVKHGFAALQSSLCCTCLPSGTIERLGVGCSDPYSASTNGAQSFLAPRGEVDAATGAIAWPIGSLVSVPPVTSALDRRLQVQVPDLDRALHPDARYFLEAVYVAPDDAAAGNGFDNASYREVTRSLSAVNGSWALFPSGPTFRGQPAVAALGAAAPTARVEEIRVPGDGALWVASDAIDLGGGAWRYELAVFALNSHRGVSGLSLPAGIAPRSEAMSFPRAHSGDPRSNAQWTSTLAAGRLRWAAPGAPGDPNANAILFGTTYSFSFECDTPPADGAVELELFRGAGPAVVHAPARVPAGYLAVTYCAAEPNSTGGIGHLLPERLVPSQSLDLVALGLPPFAIGMVVTSRTADFVPLAGGSQGNLCLGGAIGRSVGAFTVTASVAGEAGVTANLAALPQPNTVVAGMSGETWRFQMWHRDGPTGSNFTTGLAVVLP